MRARFTLLAVLMSFARADDWPQWRGPQRDGVWRESFPVEGVKIVWRAPVGAGWASPSVADGRVFVADAELVKPTARERVQGFDATSGKVLWTYAYDVSYPEWAFSPDQANGPAATPVVVDGKVYALGGSGEVLCLAAATGELLWRKDLGKEYKVPTLQCRPSPLIDGDLLIMHPGAKPGACVLALDRHTGREVWKALNESVSNSSPIIITSGGERQLIVWTGESVASLDPANGTTFWREPMTTSSNDDIATPVWSGDRLLISGLMFKLDARKPAASIVWPENRGVSKRVLSNTSTPMLAGDLVFSATNRGDLVCLDATTGAELWKTDKATDHKSGPSIHLTQHGDAFFLYNNLGELIRARLTRTGYEEISRSRVIEPVMPFGGRKLTWSPPAYANRHIFVRNERELVCASLAAGAK
ncbi:MAG: PQQ-binding-like beta-propeller repeat protein [Chthoniobacteraceae bacterium]